MLIKLELVHVHSFLLKMMVAYGEWGVVLVYGEIGNGSYDPQYILDD